MRTVILGIGISAVTMDTAVETIMRWIAMGERQIVTVAAVHSVVDAQRVPAAKRIMQTSGMCVPDGVPLVWLSRLAGRNKVERVFGPDLMLRVTYLLAQTSGHAFYYGGKQGIAEELAERMQAEYPGVGTAGCYSPPFRDLTEAEKQEIENLINNSGAGIVWVGLSSPKQEKWMEEFRPRLNAPVLIGVGAAFDYNTGRIHRAPHWVQNSGLEWLFRLIQEPQRLWRRYLVNNSLFILYWILEKLRLKKF